MQYSTPQFIEEEGKIISFLTYRQFFVLVGGGGVIILLYWTIPWFSVFIICAIAVGLVAAAVAFLKIGHQGIVSFMLSMIGFTLRPKTYTWQRKDTVQRTEIKKSPAAKPKEPPLKSVPLVAGPSKLQQIQNRVETKK